MKKNDLLIDKKLGLGSLRYPLDEKGMIDHDTLKKMVDSFIGEGFCYFELAYVYHKGAVEGALKKALVERYPRDSFVLCDKMPMGKASSYQRMWEIFNDQLQRCGVDYFDVYLLHNIGRNSYRKAEQVEAFKFLEELKSRNLVRYVGFSFHDKAEILEKILDKYAATIDVVQLQINYLDWESPVIQSRKCYEVSRSYELPVVVMEPVKGGILTDLPPEATSLIEPLGKPADCALRFAATLDGVVCVLSGMSDIMQLKENMDTFSNLKPLMNNEMDTLNKVIDLIKKEQKIQCTLCGYCIPKCPKKIPIPEIFHLANQDNIGHVGQMYKRICENKGTADDCTECGACEQVCSQLLPIREHLKTCAKTYDQPKAKKKTSAKNKTKIKKPIGKKTKIKRRAKAVLKKVGLLDICTKVWRKIK